MEKSKNGKELRGKSGLVKVDGYSSNISFFAPKMPEMSYILTLKYRYRLLYIYISFMANHCQLHPTYSY